MAGIGFPLRRLAQQDTLSGGLRAYLHAGIISSGPWLLTVLALGGIELFGRSLLAPEMVQRFSQVVIYNFAFSLVLSGPIVLVITRRLADHIHARDISEAPGMFIGALAVILAVQTALGLPFYGLVAALPLAERVLALIGLQLVGGIWLAAAFMSALKSFDSITAAFALGLATGIVGAVALTPDFGVAGMLAGFNAGLALVFFWLAARIFAEYPHPVARPFAFLGDLRRYWEFALVGLLYNAAIWVDKWIMWFAPGRSVVTGGMPSNPAYDGAMFLAYLTIVPSMALFLLAIETRFFETYLRFYRSIRNHATAAEIRRDHRAILRDLGQGLCSLAVLQAAVCYLAILVAPGLIGLARGGVEMVFIFRFGALGAACHMLLLAVMVVIAYFDFRSTMLAVAVMFFALNAGLTLGTLWLDLGYHGYGYFIAALLSLLFAYSATATRLVRLPYMTFVGNNRTLR
ncbi:exopolysaccharide Pel transporter PelG [Paracraurococcus lichenis]|uniref:Exopolysaccharide Pel transporter PelG n=1 Tax=Paracraurococcus lichenis TaxID=3064888 RepID=A0ABT9E6G5_9PROT|nr:exopolysaccharide Pel transporter PelG [Paracraurococcus sp. LOR1-02]MDO9711753.1 exopolysaccharide Pel transporter PelG [Paracraurococcus sp. LOR1-02]